MICKLCKDYLYVPNIETICQDFTRAYGPMDDDCTSRRSSRELFASRKSSPMVDISKPMSEHEISTFESILARHPPIFESLLLQLPTSSILLLYQTSSYLRSFVQRYPLAWNHLSFRAISPGRIASRQTSPASDASGDATFPQPKPHHLDQLLHNIVVPFGTRITSLTLDHTAVSGIALTQILNLRHGTLTHLSVRGCKYVSLKYHLVPFLTLWHLQRNNGHSQACQHLALRSLYAFRCRHHRRRPYTPASLARRDSDSRPTHELIKICHRLGIWTDTAWCPTPGGRCLRRRDYSLGRGVPDGRTEIWVVFDRLWRSDNRLGPASAQKQSFKGYGMGLRPDGRLWESSESGFDGEPLGCAHKLGEGEGKTTPTHLRQSHNSFVDCIQCHDCKAPIHERCEHCSVRMHCTGCRKTLCANCAFTRPLPAPVSGQSILDLSEDSFWWAPGQKRNPNLLMQEILPGARHGILPASVIPPPLATQWCCLKPQFSNGGGVTLVGPNMTQNVISYLRTAPLPQNFGFEDPEIMRLRKGSRQSETSTETKSSEVLDRILYGPDSQDSNPCPRSLCQECYGIPGWRSVCQACQEPFCYAHDLRGLSIRACGLKDLAVERQNIEDLAHLDDFAAMLTNTDASSHGTKEDILLCQSISASNKSSGQPFHNIARFSNIEEAGGVNHMSGPLQRDLEEDLLTILKDHILAEEQKLQPPSGILTWPNNMSSKLWSDMHHLASEKYSSKPAAVHKKFVKGKPHADRQNQTVPTSSIEKAQSASALELTSHIDGPTTQVEDRVLDLETGKTNETLNSGSVKAKPIGCNHVAEDCSTITSGLRWNGCRAFMCPKFRSVGDHRPACAVVVQQCSLCKVHVCPDCLRVDIPCDCSHCKTNYKCPRCFPFFAHICKKEEETALAAARQLAVEQEKAAAQLEAEHAGEFLSMAFGNDENV